MKIIDGLKKGEYIGGGMVGSPFRLNGEDLIALMTKEKINYGSKKYDTNYVICKWLVLNRFTKRYCYNYNARVLLCAYEIARNRERLSVEDFLFVIENLPDVDTSHVEMLDKARVLYKKFCGVMDGEVIMVEDFVKELFI